MVIKSRHKFVIICQCGHDHVAGVGDYGDEKDEWGYELLEECTHCSCEKFKRRQK